jgi:hypothetical protein
MYTFIIFVRREPTVFSCEQWRPDNSGESVDRQVQFSRHSASGTLNSKTMVGCANLNYATDPSSQHTRTNLPTILKSGKRLQGLNRDFPPGRPWVRKGRKSLGRTSERF